MTVLFGSFCGKNQSKIDSMTRGPTRVAICIECIEVIVDIREDEPPPRLHLDRYGNVVTPTQ